MPTVEPVTTITCQWGEGPIWWAGSLYFVDIEGRKIHRYTPESGEIRTWESGQRLGTIVPRESGGFVVAGDHGIFLFDETSGNFTALADPEADKPDNRFNDGKCSPDGRFFAGTISLIKKTGDARLYRLDPDLSLHEAFGPVTNSNGIIWSIDGRKVYYIDTPRREVLGFDYENGHFSNMIHVVSTVHIDASPDGMTMDAEGNLWIAFCHGRCVACFDVKSGKELRRIDFPCVETTACAFGGDRLQDLYVTTGVHATKVEPLGGRLFVVRGLGVSGVPAHAFAG